MIYSKGLIGFLVGSIVLVATVNGAIPLPKPQQNDLEPITLDDILSGRLGARGFSGSWVADDLVRIFQADVIVDFNITSGELIPEPVVNITKVKEQLPNGSPYSNLIFSNDGKYALVEHGRSSLWRYSSLAKYDILDVQTGELIAKLVPPGGSAEQETLQLVQWSPTGNGIAFVHNYNIYYRKNAEKDTPVRQLTTDGADEEKAIYNGISDWVYEEEMFGGPTAMWISPTGKNLAFVKFNDSNVREFQWPMYGEPGADTVYPEYRNIRYPKSGTPNPEANVHVISLDDDNSQAVKVAYPNTVPGDTHLIGRVVWATDDKLLVVTLNRNQTTSQFHQCAITPTPGNCERFYTYQLDHGWVDTNTPKVNKDGSLLIFQRSVQVTPEESYNHIVQVEVGGQGTGKQITNGSLSVKSILGWDETNHRIYFSGTFWDGMNADDTETQIYSIAADGTEAEARCITCGLQNRNDEECRENSAQFSTDFTYFIHRCGGPGVPETDTRMVETGGAVDTSGPTFVDNKALREALQKKAVPERVEYLDIPVGQGGRFKARMRVQKPKNFDASKKYPLLVSVYGGPGSKALGQGHGVQWETSLVSDREIIFAQIDGRGTSGKSSEHMWELHRKLGTAEMEDQIAATKWLLENEDFIDPNRTSIWGWSYGGYSTVKVLEMDKEHVFKCGISVAPVTSWRYYDTIYTERYMSLPTEDDNLDSYKSSDATSKEAIENLRHKQLMLVHGNADDNVHYQQSMILARAMEQNDVFFHQLSYPDENHGISGPGMRRHLYHSLERFLFDECFAAEKGNEDGDNTTPNTTPTGPDGGDEDTTPRSTTEAGASGIQAFPLLIVTVVTVWLRLGY